MISLISEQLSIIHLLYIFFFFLMIRRPPRSTLFPTRRSSDLPPTPFVNTDVSVFFANAANFPWRSHAKWFLREMRDRKSTRLNSSHSQISYAVFCLKKKKQK